MALADTVLVIGRLFGFWRGLPHRRHFTRITWRDDGEKSPARRSLELEKIIIAASAA